MIIRKATEADIPQILEIYNETMIEEENGRTHIGWIRDVYPTEATARKALSEGELFIIEDDKQVAATAIINQKQVPEYVDAAWESSEALDEEVMVLHTLVVSPKRAGKGYGSAFVKFYEAYALEHNCPYLRMDTNETNAVARRLYKHLGYREAGIVNCVFNGIPGVHLVCLEKKL